MDKKWVPKPYLKITVIVGLMSMVLIFLFNCLNNHQPKLSSRRASDDVITRSRSAPMPWLNQPATLWQRDFSGSARDSLIPVPANDLEEEGIGKKTNVDNLFDRWHLNEYIRSDRGVHYAEITDECKGMIEIDFALTPEEWQKAENRIKYYRTIDELITKIGDQLLDDFGNILAGDERVFFLRALKTLAWQESKWQHYLRYKDWFFVIVSGGSYNKLDDWGITQIARSSFDSEVRLNNNLFDSMGYCSISGTLYYGFMEYYFCYLEARENPNNGPSLFNKIVGAYNRYCSGYSSCYYELAQHDDAYRNYQIRGMGSFKDKFILKPWEKLMALPATNPPPEQRYTFDQGAIIRGDTSLKRIALLFTGHEFADGGQHILTVLTDKQVNASFFFTGDFCRNPNHRELIKKLLLAGHFLGPHSDKHLLYCSWQKRDSLLVTREQFIADILDNYQAVEQFGITKSEAPCFIPPFEWYNQQIVAWAKELDLIVINFTPGTGSHTDYTTPDLSNYAPSSQIYKNILQYEQTADHGLNGFLLLIHIGTDPGRVDKFYYRLAELIIELQKRGYSFVRVDEMLP